MTDMKPVILGCAGVALSNEEKALFTEHNPAGLILFQRNCQSKSQVADLVAQFRDIVGREDAPVLIDQEGGSVARLKSPEWREYPSSGFFGEMSDHRFDDAVLAVRLNAQLMAMELRSMGVTVNCNPILDVPSEQCHGFLSDSRTFHANPDRVFEMGRAVCEGLLDGGVMPIIKHIPGHGRATVDSHKSLPVVDADRAELEKTDFEPFRRISALKWGNDVWAMAAHVIYSGIDHDSVASQSRQITEGIIRDYMGFDGVLLADDISMQALSGGLAERAVKTLDAGMDLTMYCNGQFDEMANILEALPPISATAETRMARAEQCRQAFCKDDLDEQHILSEWTELIGTQHAA